MLRQEAAEAIAKLKLRKYRRKARDLSCSTSKHQKKESEVCAVCLDEFHNNQVKLKSQHDYFSLTNITEYSSLIIKLL